MKKAVKLHPFESVDSLIRIVNIIKENIEVQSEIPPYHYHDMYELALVKKGSAEFIVNESIRKIESGTVVFFGNQSHHGVINYCEDVDVLIIHLSKTIFSWNMEKFPEINREVQFLRDGQFCYVIKNEQVMSKLLKLLDHVDCLQGMMKLSAIYEIIHILASSPKDEILGKECTVSHLHREFHTPIERAYRYIYLHFMESLTLEQIALYANQNQTALCRSFKRGAGITIFELINKLRIEKACTLLRFSSMSISQIAYYVGYNCFSNFSIKFKATIKTSPTQYRLASLRSADKNE